MKRTESTPRAGPSHRRHLGARVLLTLFGIFAGLVIGELAVRLFGLGPDVNVIYRHNYRLSENPVLQYELLPGSRDGDFRINEAGLRSRAFRVEKEAEVFRILLIGDSIAYGFGVEQNETFSVQFEDLHSMYWPDAQGRVEILNLGVAGYNIDQIVENLLVRGLQFDPDLIVYGFCLNDPMTYSFEFEALKVQLSQAKASYREGLMGKRGYLLSMSRLFLLAKYAWTSAHDQGSDQSKLEDKQWTAIADDSYDRFFSRVYEDVSALNRLGSGLDQLKQIAREVDVPVVTVIFPLFHHLDAYRLEQLHGKVQEMHLEREMRVYDLLRLFGNLHDSQGRVYVHNVLHPNRLGHRLAALYVLLKLMKDDMLPFSAQLGQRPAPEDRALWAAAERTLQESTGATGE